MLFCGVGDLLLGPWLPAMHGSYIATYCIHVKLMIMFATNQYDSSTSVITSLHRMLSALPHLHTNIIHFDTKPKSILALWYPQYGQIYFKMQASSAYDSWYCGNKIVAYSWNWLTQLLLGHNSSITDVTSEGTYIARTWS